MDSFESNGWSPPEQPPPTAAVATRSSMSSSAYQGLITRPIATYSPMADSGYHTDSPIPANSSSSSSYTPPPGTFRPVSPADVPAVSALRHVATQTSQTEHRLQQIPVPLPPPPPPPPPPMLLSQQSTGFRPASAPIYDDQPDGLRDMVSGVDNGGAFGGGLGGLDDLDPEFDEEVYRTSAVQLQQPLPDLLQQHAADSAANPDEAVAVRLRTRSVPVPDLASRHERVALLLREIGDQYNMSRGGSPAAGGAVGGRASVHMFGYARRDRSQSLRNADPMGETGPEGGDADPDNWRGSILNWVAQMVRTLSGADIALDEDNPEANS